MSAVYWSITSNCLLLLREIEAGASMAEAFRALPAKRQGGLMNALHAMSRRGLITCSYASGTPRAALTEYGRAALHFLSQVPKDDGGDVDTVGNAQSCRAHREGISP